MDYRKNYEEWLNEPTLDADTRVELVKAALDEKDLEDRFYRSLSFGTAGLRGILGAGTNRMNTYVVRRATLGLARYLSGVSGAAERGVCIAYDSRRLSREFARETAAVLAGSGIRVYLFTTLHAVPQLSFTLRHLGCIAGVVITASHNPKIYNGYKVYWEHGGQVAPVQADAILACIESTGMFEARPVYDSPLITLIGEKEDEAYYAASESVMLCREAVQHTGARLRVVYTPLFGTGRVPVTMLLTRAGMTNVSIVDAQAEPNGDFPGLSAPNPEDPDAFKLAIAQAEATGAAVCLATDPDADRLGVAVRTRAGDWALLSGNQIGCLLLEHILSSLHAQQRLPENGAVVKSIVSTPLADAICKAYGVAIENVMTGFRFISEKVDSWQKSGEKTFLFGFEESFGFLAGGHSRDKDAVLAALLAAEACVICQNRGITLYDMLGELYAKYGYYKESARSYTLAGKEGLEKIAACMARLRAEPTAAFAGDAVVVREDYLSDTAPKNLPHADMLRYVLASGAWLIVRPSGTEPKLKLYIGANASEESTVDARLNDLLSDADARLAEYLS